jgi:hypothetical protein
MPYKIEGSRKYPYYEKSLLNGQEDERPCPMSRKTREGSVKNTHCLTTERRSLGILAFRPPVFRVNLPAVGRVGIVLNFFASFFGSSQKMKWGLGQSPNVKQMHQKL